MNASRHSLPHSIASIIQLSVQTKHPPTLPGGGLCYDVCYQDALTVLVLASGWSEPRGASSFGGG
jgi:hypothetical protein